MGKRERVGEGRGKGERVGEGRGERSGKRNQGVRGERRSKVRRLMLVVEKRGNGREGKR